MIRVSLQSDTRGQIKVFVCIGHAGLVVESGGEDLLCAGVSALCGALAIGLERVVRASVFIREGRGLFYIRLEEVNPELIDKAQVLFNSTAEALRELSCYNEGFLTVQNFTESDPFPTVEDCEAEVEAENEAENSSDFDECSIELGTEAELRTLNEAVE
ncbi:MAG: ribosomal-processing cysteine protease Prp [Candidatus Bruticola sp.]